MAEEISDLQVMKSAAGWYIGQGYRDLSMGMTPEDGFPLPYSRQSEYFATAEEAQRVLDAWNAQEAAADDEDWEDDIPF